ncbi:MAG: hypothetical protein IJA36_09045 [Lachnospiraceae bacterium]|nr:hypothetical protein [Lachnospiraceae bacterium]
MTNEELLSAISDMLDEKLDQKLDEKLEQKLDEKLDQKLDEKLDQKLEPLKNSITTMQHDIYEIKDKQQQMGLVLENDVLPRLQNIESCYISTYDRYKNSVDDYEVMKQDIDLLKKVVAEHSEKLQKIS